MTSKQYILPETTRTWTDGGEEEMDLRALAADGVVMGSYWDRGASARAAWFNYELTIDGFDTAPVIDEAVLLFLSFSNAATNFDGNPTTDPTDAGEGTMTTAQLRNILPLDAAVVYSVTAANELKISGQVFIGMRYISPVIHNATADALLTAGSHTFILEPIPPQQQNT